MGTVKARFDIEQIQSLLPGVISTPEIPPTPTGSQESLARSHGSKFKPIKMNLEVNIKKETVLSDADATASAAAAQSTCIGSCMLYAPVLYGTTHPLTAGKVTGA